MDIDLAIDYLQNGNIEQAKNLFIKLAEKSPNDHAVLNNLSLCYAIMGNLTEAINFAQKSVALAPDNFMCHGNLGLLCRQAGLLEESREHLSAACAINPNPDIICALGLVNWELGNVADAHQNFDEALKFNPDNPNMWLNKALLCLQSGEIKSGLEHYLWRFKASGPSEHYVRVYDQSKLWDGKTDLCDKKIIVYGEQGNGDVIQFARYLEKLMTLGAYVIFHVPERLAFVLHELFDESFCADISTLDLKDLPDHDYHCPSMSLPLLLNDLEVVGKPYVASGERCVNDRMAIAVAWAGSHLHPNDSNRSIPITDFCRIFESDANFYSLQFGLEEQFYRKVPIYDATQGIDDFGGTASLIDTVDLVIACDTSIIHLAGAMGKPAWVIVPHHCDWRWGFHGEKTPWYDSVRIFRQHRHGDWTGVMQEVKEALDLKILNR